MAILDEEGRPIERYEYSPYGQQKIRADLTEPSLEQVRSVDGALWLEVSERVDFLRLQQSLASGQLRLENVTTSTNLPVTSIAQPVPTGRQGGRRYVLELAGAPATGDTVRLVLEPGALLDDFLNINDEVAADWTWTGLDEVVLDTRPPQIAEVRVRDNRIEIELTEEVDPQSANTTVTIDGAQTGWNLLEDRYTLRSILSVSPLSHTVHITPGIADLSGKLQPESLEVLLPASPSDRLVYRRTDPTEIPVSSAANAYGFHGAELDPATGLVYMRNRWYDPEMGRFITADPLGYMDGPSAYQFGRNNPINFSDPFGELTIFINGINNQAYPGLDPEEKRFFDSLEDPADHEFNEPIYGPAFKATWPARIQGEIEAGLTWLKLRSREVREVWTALESSGDLMRLNPREPVILIGHSGGRPVAQRLAKKIRNYLREEGLQDHPIWVIGYNGAFDRQRPPDGVDGIRVVSDDDVLGLLRLWKRGDLTVPGGHGPDLGKSVSTVFNAMIWLLHFDAEHPGAIRAALGGGPKRSSRAIIDYMSQRMSTMAPGDPVVLIEAMKAELTGATEQP